MKKVLIALLLAVAVPNAAHADYVIWPDTNGIIFPYVPNGASVGDCYGNCGAGCSGDVNPCGGPERYWDLQFIAGPDYVRTTVEQRCDGIELLEETKEVYQAIGRWTFHGSVMTGCIQHDGLCNQWLLGCVLFYGCGEHLYHQTWSYDEWMQGTKVVYTENLGINEYICGH